MAGQAEQEQTESVSFGYSLYASAMDGRISDLMFFGSSLKNPIYI